MAKSENIIEQLRRYLWGDSFKNTVERNETVEILVIGKIGAGKSSFINAFRQKTRSDEDAARVSFGANSGNSNIKGYKYEYMNETTYKTERINFYDTAGFADTDKKNELEEAIKDFQEKKNINFDAIIFLTEAGRLFDFEVECIRQQEDKMCLLLLVMNQIDNFKYQATYDVDKKDKEAIFMKELNKLKNDNLKKLQEKNVAKRLDVKNIYAITSSKDKIFKDDNISPDGARLKEVLEKHLFNIRGGEPLDLMNPYTKQLINYKSKVIKNTILLNLKAKLFAYSLSTIIPFLDIAVGSSIRNNFNTHFLMEFGLLVLFDKIDNKQDIKISEDNIIRKDDSRWIKIRDIKSSLSESEAFSVLTKLQKVTGLMKFLEELADASCNIHDILHIT